MQCINFRSNVQQYNVEEWLFWVLFLEFLLFVEFMEPGQLSISLYSVCKISDLNTEPLSVDTGVFLSTTSSVLSESCLSIMFSGFFSSLGQQRMVFTMAANTNAQRGCV